MAKKKILIKQSIKIRLPEDKIAEYNDHISKENTMLAILQGMLFLNMNDNGKFIEAYNKQLWNNTKKHFAISAQWFERWHKQVAQNLAKGEEGWKLYQQYFTTTYNEMFVTLMKIENKLSQLYGLANYPEATLMGKVSIPIIFATYIYERYVSLVQWAEEYIKANVVFSHDIKDKKADAALREQTTLMSHKSASRMVAQNVWVRPEPVIYQTTLLNKKTEKETKAIIDKCAEKQGKYVGSLLDVFDNKMSSIVTSEMFQKCKEIINNSDD